MFLDLQLCFPRKGTLTLTLGIGVGWVGGGGGGDHIGPFKTFLRPVSYSMPIDDFAYGIFGRLSYIFL